MPGKYETTVQLAAQTAKKIARDGNSYLAFLTTAAHNFKYNFRDQLLIFAQKPDATACAEISFWNRHGRWVNRGTKGIALLVDTDGPYKLRHVFDQSDTNSRAGRTVPVWQMQPQYEQAVMETLENLYGEPADTSNLAASLLGTAKNLAEDNYSDYLAQLNAAKAGSCLEALDSDQTETLFQDILEHSVAHMLLTRCGKDPAVYHAARDFARIVDFSTPETISILGAAVSDISEMALREIAATVLDRQKAERQQRDSVALPHEKVYAESTKENTERGLENGTDLPDRGRLSAAQSDRPQSAEAGQVRDAAAQLSAGEPQRSLHRDDAGRHAEPASGGDRPAGERDDGASDGADGAAARRDGGTESGQPHEMGGLDEQHPGIGGGNGADRSGLQLIDPLPPSEEPLQASIDWTAAGPTGLQFSHHDFNALSEIPYYHEDDEKNELLRTSDALKKHRAEIAAFFACHTDGKERGDFVKGFFDNTYVESILHSGQRAGYRAWDDVLTLWRGSYPSREKEVFLRWPTVASTIHGMIMLHQWLDPDESILPGEAQQIAFIEQAEAEKASAFSMPQEAIDYVLCGGSGVSQSKLRIYAQFEKNADTQENIKFLRDEYGVGGRSDAIPGSGIWEDYDSKGFRLRRNLGTDENDEVFLSWGKVEKRIRELIAANRYLNPAEKEQYPEYLAKVRERAARWDVVNEYRSIIDDYLDFKTQLGEQEHNGSVLLARKCADCFGTEEKKSYVLTIKGDFALPIMREAMHTIIKDNTHLTERCNAMLDILNGPMAASMEPTYEDLHPPKQEYRFSLGDTVHLGTHEYEMLAFDEQTVRLFDPAFPLLNKEMGRADFDRMLAENPLNDRLLQIVEKTPAIPSQEAEKEIPVVTTPQESPAMEKAMQLINEYCQQEFEEDADFSDLSQVGLAYSTICDSTHDVEISVDLLRSRLVYLVDGKELETIQCHDLNELIGYLVNLNFDEMVAYAEEQYEQQREQAAEPQQETDDFSDIDPAAVRAALAEHGIVDGQLVDPEKLDASPMIQEIKAVAEKNAANVPPTHDRFSIIETENGYAIWDDLRSEIYVDSDGVQEEFSSEWQADDYLDQVRRSVSDQEAVEWLTAERAKTEPEPVEQAEKAHEAEPEDKDAGKPTQERANNTTAPTLSPPVSKPKANVSPFVLHPEIPDAARQEYHITDDTIGVGTPGERFKNNIRAIRLLKKLESEDRLATPEEQAILAQYVGWGGLSDCFEERHSKYAELKALLTDDEYAAARESTLTAFYTPPTVIRSIYQALENMGFKTGNLLEPSCGIGNFIGMRPESLSESKFYGIELDSISGRITRQLYQKSSIAVQGFEKTDLPDSFFDAAIGNVPFGNFKIQDKRYDKHNFLIHDYFFGRTLDKVRPGGIIAFVTSKGTMDKENPNVRRYIAQRADLLGAIRLPNDTFKGAAGTEVTSDIIFLQKRAALSCEEPAWVHLNTDANGLKMNQYFIDNPQMVLGEMKEVSGPYGPETACLSREGQDLVELLTAAVQNIRGQIIDYAMEDPDAEEDRSIPADPSVRNFSYTVVDGRVYFRENSRMNPVDLSVTASNRVKDLIGIRDCVRTLIEYQTEDGSDEDIQTGQRKLNALYDAFVEKYGRINARANKSAFVQDSSYFLLSSLEILDDEQNFVRKADMFSKRTIRHREIVQYVDTASEALAVSMGEKAKVDMPYMMQLTGKTEQEVYTDLTGVIFLNPLYGNGGGNEEKYLTADEYLSGNVREKLRLARKSAELHPEDYTTHVQALEQVQPVDLTPGEISVRLGATWIPPDDVKRFIFELFDTPSYMRWNIRVHYSTYTGEWNIEGKSIDKANIKTNNVYGTLRANGYKIVEETLNLRDVRIFDYVTDDDGRKTAVLNKKETAIAQGKQELIKQAFQDWIWKDPKRRERLVQSYNEKFNSIRPREYDGRHIRFVGMNPEITLRPHQVNAIAHILYGGNTLLAHVVGAGKTFEMVAAAQESKRLGLCQKSLFVVPNHLTEQWAAEYLQLYPSANILVATKKDFETRNRKRFCGRIATGDYDAVIIGHSQFEKIPMSLERQIFILEQQKDELLKGIAELKANRGERFSIKQMEKSRKAIDVKLQKLNDQSRKDDVVTFEELGVDRLFVDEAHYYKNRAKRCTISRC